MKKTHIALKHGKWCLSYDHPCWGCRIWFVLRIFQFFQIIGLNLTDDALDFISQFSIWFQLGIVLMFKITFKSHQVKSPDLAGPLTFDHLENKRFGNFCTNKVIVFPLCGMWNRLVGTTIHSNPYIPHDSNNSCSSIR